MELLESKSQVFPVLKGLTECPNYRESRSITFRKTYFATDKELEPCVEKMSAKIKLETSNLTPWRESGLTMIKEKIGN